MRKLVSRLVISLILGFLLAGVVAFPVYATIGNPTSVTIGDAFVFRDVLSSGDQLYFVRYNVDYDGVPEEDAEDTWELALYNSVGSLVATQNLWYYENNIISIYLTPGKALAWEGTHKLIIRGNPAIFILEEGTNQRTRTLGPGDYYEASSLGGIMLSQADILEGLGWPTILDTGRLNITGSYYFLKAVPGLNVMAPGIFRTIVSYPSADYTEWDVGYQESLQEKSGPRLDNAITGIGSIFGISEGWSGLWLGTLVYLLFAGVIYASTKNAAFSLIVPFPGLVGLAWLGVGTTWLQVVAIVVLVVAILFGVYFILARFA